MRLHKLRSLHRLLFGNKNYQRLYPVIDFLKEVSLDYLSESNKIRAKYNSKGLKDPSQKGYSDYQIFAILRVLADLNDDNSDEAIAKLLSGQCQKTRVSPAKLALLKNDSQKYSKQAVSDWVVTQSTDDQTDQLLLDRELSA